MPILEQRILTNIHNTMWGLKLYYKVWLNTYTPEERKYITELIINQDYKKAEKNGFCFELNDTLTQFQKIRYDVNNLIFK